MFVSRHEGWFGLHPGEPSVLDRLPVGVYSVEFDTTRGFFLQPSESEGVILSDDAVMLGSNAGKERKIIEAYRRRSTSTGVLLSGDRGLGKTMLLRRVARLALTDLRIPVIILPFAYEGVAGFLANISQEFVLVLDELEKMFTDEDDQNMLLSLLDGVSSHRRLVLATVNNVNKLSDHMMGRPNRFYYHLRFDYPLFDDAVAYLRGKGVELDEDGLMQLRAVTLLQPFNYDILSALADELNAGYGMDESLDDLNTENSVGCCVMLDVAMELEGGCVVRGSTWVDRGDLSLDTQRKRYGVFRVSLYDSAGTAMPDNSVCVRPVRATDTGFVLEVVEHKITMLLRVSDELKRTSPGLVTSMVEGHEVVRVTRAVAVPAPGQWSHGAKRSDQVGDADGFVCCDPAPVGD